jgi:hypothetical protein
MTCGRSTRDSEQRMKRRAATGNAMLFAALLVQWVLGMAF